MTTDKKCRRNSKVRSPTNIQEVHSILGVIQYYRDMWPRRSHTLAPLTDLISSKNISGSQSKTDKLRKIDWTQECQEAFDTMKRLVARDVLLAYPQFDQPFEVTTAASKRQLGICI